MTETEDGNWEREFRKHQAKYDIKPKHKERQRPKKFKKIEIIINKAEGIFKNHKFLTMEANFKETTNPKILRKTFESSFGKFLNVNEKLYFNEPSGRTNYEKAQFTIKFETPEDKRENKVVYKVLLDFKEILEDVYFSETASSIVKFSKGQDTTKYEVHMSLQAFGFSKE